MRSARLPPFCDVRHHAAPHQVEQEWRKAGLYDVTAKHDDDRPLVPRRAHDRLDDCAKIARDEHVRQGAEERSERLIAARSARWVGELAREDLVWTPGDRNGANGGQVRLASHFFAPGVVTRLSGAAAVGDGWYDLR